MQVRKSLVPGVEYASRENVSQSPQVWKTQLWKNETFSLINITENEHCKNIRTKINAVDYTCRRFEQLLMMLPRE
jgi:hypothetical protein